MRTFYSIGVVAALLVASGFVSAEISIDNNTVQVRLNQLGYQPNAQKVAIVTVAKDSQKKAFRIVNSTSDVIVYEGLLSDGKKWDYSGEQVQQADFSALRVAGRYRLKVHGVTESHPFEINDTVYHDVHKASIKSYYFNRSGIAIEAKYGGVFARAAGHPDIEVKVHASAATEQRPIGTKLASSKGWYDAGDYGKYVVNSGISTYTLLAAFQHYPDLYRTLTLGIPESGDDTPDLIDEIRWNLDWMESMQDIDGGVYHKLTTLRFSPEDTRPADAKQQRYMIGKSVTATLDFAAVMAMASRVVGEFDTTAAQRYKQNALRAYEWASDNPQAVYQQPKDVNTGEYGNQDVADEFAWAEAELFLMTGERKYFKQFLARNVSAAQNLSWPSVGALAYISLVSSGQESLSLKEFSKLKAQVVAAADQHLEVFNNSAYGVSISEPDFVWGSNGDVLNNGVILVQAYRLTEDKKYHTAAMSTLDYVLGKNATGYSFVTGYGDKTPMLIHHRPSISDDVKNPVPGFLAGGPHAGKQDGCEYAADKPATTYSDTVCSYSTNEIAINWNAPLVYMLAAAISAN